MSNHDLKLVWVPVQDAHGHTRMEMRWLDLRTPTAPRLSPAA